MNRLYSTEAGSQIVQESPELRGAVGRFLFTKNSPDVITGGLPSIGGGNESNAYQVQGVVLKLSSEVTTRSRRVPNLVNQFKFMNTLHHYLETRDTGVTTPEQYFAIQNSAGESLLGLEMMAGWGTLASWMKADRTDTILMAEIMKHTKRRIFDSVQHPLLRMGLNDVYPTNILIPGNTSDPMETPLCLIDQPRGGSTAYIGGLLAPRLRLANPLALEAQLRQAA